MFIDWPSWNGNGPREQPGIDKPFSISSAVRNFEKTNAIACFKKQKKTLG
jgi:hypothetical protein